MHARLFRLLAAGAALVALAATPARADAIDGDWCKADGKHEATDAPIQVWNRCPPGVADARPATEANA